MLDITVKTLDGRNRSFFVPDDITVRQFKEKIASSIEIDADIQRLIFQGRVLDDDKKIDDYNVNGKTIHVVQRTPPSARAASAAGLSSSATEPGQAPGERPRMDGSSFVVGSFSIPPDATDMNQVHADGPSVDVHINVSHGPQLHSESQIRISQAMHMLSLASTALDRLERQHDNDSDITDSATASPPETNDATQATASGGATGTSSASNGSRVEHPQTSALSPVLEEMLRLHSRLQPHLLRYRQIMSDDQDYTNRSEMMSAQRLCNLTSEVLHSLSHVYHHVSDLMVDMSRTPPRNLRAPPPMPTTAIIQQTIPVQINVAHVPVSTTVSNTESSGSTTTTASQQQQQPQPPTSTSTPFGFPPMGGLPQFRMGSSSGIPIPTAGGMPQGMHVFMDMAPGMGFRVPFGMQGSSSGRPATSSTATTTDTSSAAGARAAPSAGAGAGAAAFPPGDFLQNIIQMATNSGLQGQPGGARWMSMPDQSTSASYDGAQSRNSANSSASARSSSSSSATSSTSQNVGSMPTGVGFPGMPSMGVPPMAMPPGATPADLLPVDPCLPCHSRHFHNRRAQMATGQGTSAGSDQNQEPNLAGMVTNLVSSIVGPLAAAGMGPVEINQARATSAPSYSSSTASSSLSGSATASSSSTRSSSSTSTSRTSASGAAGNQNADLGLGGVPTLMQALNGQSIADFLSTIGMEYAPAQGEGLLADLFHIIATHMVFTDLTMVFFGVPTPLERLREPLQQYIHENVLNGNSVTEANVDSAVDRLMRGIQPDIDAIGELPTRNNIDFLATLTQFIRINLRRAVCLIADATVESGFAASLYDLCRNIVHEFVVLCRHCLEGGQAALETMFQERLRSFSSEVSPPMQTMMSNMAVQQLRMIVPLIRLSDDDIQRYIVLRSAAVDSVSSDNSFASASDAVVDGADGGTEEDETVCMEEQTESVAISRPSPVTAALLSQLPPPPQNDSDADMQVNYGSEDWHSAVPTEWIPVITRDIIRQRRQAPQPSLSDAYMSGMPSKRRKVVKRDRQHDETNFVVISEALKRAAQRAGAQPTTSQSQLAEDVAESPALCTAFQREMNSAISRRLENDSDYMPEKYPNTEKFFKSE